MDVKSEANMASSLVDQDINMTNDQEAILQKDIVSNAPIEIK